MAKNDIIVEEHVNPSTLYNSSIANKNTQNIILYGPPGTGKTYHSLPLAMSLIEGKDLSHLMTEDYASLQNRSQNLSESGQLVRLSFHQSFSYEEFMEGLSPNLSAGQLLFEQKEGIFKQLVTRARKNYEAFSQKQNLPSIPFIDLLNLLFTKEINPDTEEITLQLESQHRIYKAIVIFDVSEDALLYRRLTKNNLLKQEERRLSLHKLKALYQGEELKEAINLKYYEAVIKAVNRYKENLITPDKTQELKQYVLVIDEINRANLSQVFGELITLLEPDKRLGQAQATTLTLASGEKFALPPNLHLIGTMNGQERNSTWLDAALQRRFQFWAMYPQEELITNSKIRQMLQKLNQFILAEKGSPDYLIGHAFFMHKTLSEAIDIFKYQILPLLQQYFGAQPDFIHNLLKDIGIDAHQQGYQWQLRWQ